MKEKLEKIFEKVKLINANATEIFNLAISYFEDGKYFLENKDLIKAFECFVIVWSYLDACLHLNLIEIPNEFKNYFTKD